MKKRTNYKKLYGITLKQAKEMSIAKIGRLPRCGYELQIIRGINEYGHEFIIFLQNNSGSFSIRKWTSVNFSR